jgi:hypothetical protein
MAQLKLSCILRCDQIHCNEFGHTVVLLLLKSDLDVGQICKFNKLFKATSVNKFKTIMAINLVTLVLLKSDLDVEQIS